MTPLEHVPAWRPDGAYRSGAVVVYRGAMWQAVADPPTGAAPAPPEWRLLYTATDKAAAAKSLDPRIGRGS